MSSLRQDELGRQSLFLWAMETRASFTASMRETQHLSPEKDPSPANGDGEQFDSGELPFPSTSPCHCCSSSQVEVGTAVLPERLWEWLYSSKPFYESYGSKCVLWLVGNRSFSSSGSLWQYLSAIQNLNKKPWKTVLKASYCVLPASPPFFILLKFCGWREKMNIRKFQHFSFVLTSPLFSFAVFWSASGEGASQTRDQPEESWSHVVLVLMTGCFVMFWDGLLKLRIRCAKSVHSVIDTEK